MKVPTAVITAARLMVSLGGHRRAGPFLVQREQLGGNAGLDHQFHAPQRWTTAQCKNGVQIAKVTSTASTARSEALRTGRPTRLSSTAVRHSSASQISNRYTRAGRGDLGGRLLVDLE